MVATEKSIYMTDLVQRCKNGDQQAYADIYQSCAHKVYNAIFRFVAHTGEAEDIMQECFIDAFTKIDTYIGTGSLEGWIRSIAVNKALTHLRNKKMTFTEIENHIQHITANDDDHMSYEKYSNDQIHQAILQLSDGYRTIVNLYVFEDIPHEEIAGILGISHSTVRSQYHRAKKRIEMILKSFDQ